MREIKSIDTFSRMAYTPLWDGPVPDYPPDPLSMNLDNCDDELRTSAYKMKSVEFREIRGAMTQVELSQILGYTANPNPTIWRFESGDRPIPPEVAYMMRMIKKHGVPKELYRDDGKKPIERLMWMLYTYHVPREFAR